MKNKTFQTAIPENDYTTTDLTSRHKFQMGDKARFRTDFPEYFESLSQVRKDHINQECEVIGYYHFASENKRYWVRFADGYVMAQNGGWFEKVS